jgi:hypothetical protein
VVFFAPLRFVLRSLYVGIAYISVVCQPEAPTCLVLPSTQNNLPYLHMNTTASLRPKHSSFSFSIMLLLLLLLLLLLGGGRGRPSRCH